MSKKINIDVNLRDEEAKEKLKNLQDGKYEVDVDVNADGINQATHGMERLSTSAKNTNTVFGKLRNTISDTFSTGKLAMTGYLAVLNEIRKASKNASQTIEDVDKATTDLSIATGMTRKETAGLVKDYNAYAKELKSTTTQITAAADDYLRAGKTMSEAKDLVKDSIMLSKLGQINSSEATEDLLATMNGYNMSVEETGKALDAMVAIDFQAATSSGDLATGLKYSASSAASAGVSFNKLVAILGTVQDRTQQTAQVVGVFANTMLSRYRDVTIGKYLSDDGEDISNYESVLKSVGIQLRDQQGEFRDFETVLQEMADKWDSLTSVQQNSLIKVAAGTRQQNRFIALMENYNKVLELTEVAANSAGTALDKFNNSYANSLEAKKNTLQATFESMIVNSNFDEVYADILDATTALVKFVDETNALKGAFTGLTTLAGIKGFLAIRTGINEAYISLNQFQNALKITNQTAISTDDFDRLLLLSKNLSQSQMKLLLSSKNLTNVQREQILINSGLSKEESKLVLESYGLTKAQTGLTIATTSLKNAAKGLWNTLIANPLVMVTAAVSATVMAYSSYKQKLEETRKANVETADSASETAENLRQVYVQYEKLSEITNKTTDQEKEYKTVIENITSILGDRSEALKGLTAGTQEYTDTLRELTKAELEEQYTSAVVGRKSAEEEFQGDIWSPAKGSKVLVDSNSKGNKLSDEAQKAVDIVSDALSEYETINRTWKNISWDISSDEPEQAVDYYNSLIKARELLVAEAKDDEALLDTEIYEDINNAINTMSDSMDTYINKKYEELKLDYMVQNGIPTTVEEYQAMEKSIKNATSASQGLQDSIMDLLLDDFSDLSANIQVDTSVDVEVKEDDLDTTPITQSISSTVSQLNTQLKPVFSSLQTAYQDIFSNGFSVKDIDISDFESIRSALEKLGEELSVDIDYSSFDNFVSVLSNTESTSDEVQKAFNELATTITDLGVNGAEDFETLKKALSDFGIINNDIIAFNGLLQNTEALKEAGLDLADATSEDIQEFVSARVEAENYQQALSLVVQQKLENLSTAINSQDDINDLITLAQAAGIASSAIARLGGLKLAYDNEVANGSSQAALAIASQMESLKAQIQAEITGLYGDSTPKFNGSKKSKSTSGSSSDSTKTFDWIERAIQEIESKISDLDNTINSTFSSVSEKNDALLNQIGLINDEIELQQKAYEGYMQKADSVGLSDYYKGLVQNGAINIEDIKDKALQQRIQDYQDYYDKAQDTLDKINQLHEQAMQKHVDAYDNEADALKDKLDNQSITEKQYISEMDSLWRKYFENQVEYAEVAKQKKLELLKEEKSYLQSVGSAAIALLDDEVDKLESQKESATKAYQDQIDALENLKKPLEVELDLMTKAKDATNKQLEYEKALYELRRAENQRVNLTYVDGQMVYRADDANIRDKKEAVDDAQYELLKLRIQDQIDDYDRQIDKLNDLIDQTEKYYDTQIDGLNKYKEEWQKAIDMEEIAVNMQNFIDNFGEGSIGRLFNEDMSLITEWKQSYLDNLAEIDITSNGVVGDITKKFSELSGLDISPSISSIDALKDAGADAVNTLSSGISEVNSKINGNSGSETGSVKQSGYDNAQGSSETGSLTSAMTELSDTALNEDTGIPAQTSAWENMEVPLNTIYELLNNIKVTLEDLDGKTFTVTLNANSSIPNIASTVKSAAFSNSNAPSSGGGRAFANGTNGLTHAEKNALISEYNQPELVIYPNGAYQLVTSPTITDLPKDTVVLNEEQTKKAMHGDTVSGKTFADGTVPGHPELRPLQPGDKEYGYLMKAQKYFEQNTDALIQNTNMWEKQCKNLIRDARNINNNVVNNQQRVVNQTINVSLPNVTDNTSATVLLNDLKSISTKKLQYNWGK